MAEIDVELTKITTKFSENVLDSTNAFELIVTDEAKLAGLPPSAIDAARQSAESKKRRWLAIHSAGSQLHPGADLSGRPGDSRTDVPRFCHARDGAGARQSSAARAHSGTAPRKSAAAGISRFRRLRSARPHGAQRRTGDEIPRRPESARPIRSSRKKTRRSKLSPDRSWSPGMSAIGPRSSAARSTISMKKSCARTSRPSAWSKACSPSSSGSTASRCEQRDGVPVWHPDVRYYEVHDRDGAAAGRVLCRLVSARIEARRRMDGSLHYRQLVFAGRRTISNRMWAASAAI